MQINDLNIGEQARILSLAKGDLAYRQKLLAMGLLPGSVLSISRIAPLGDPVEIQIRGVSLSLRKEEANLLQLEFISRTNENDSHSL
jgi:ferrous iron transport protein A